MNELKEFLNKCYINVWIYKWKSNKGMKECLGGKFGLICCYCLIGKSWNCDEVEEFIMLRC